MKCCRTDILPLSKRWNVIGFATEKLCNHVEKAINGNNKYTNYFIEVALLVRNDIVRLRKK